MRHLNAAMAVLLVCMLSGPALAGDINVWKGPFEAPGDWALPGNWTRSGSTSTSYDQYVVDNGGTAVISGGEVTDATLVAGRSGRGTILQEGGSVRLDDKTQLLVGWQAGSDGLYRLTGGELLGIWSMPRYREHLLIGVAGTGRFEQAGGLVDVSIIKMGSSGTGTYALSGGTLYSRYGLQVGAPGEALFDQTGGTHEGAYVDIGERGTYRLNGGTFRTTEGLISRGTLDFGTPGGVFEVGGIVDLSRGSLTNAANGAVQVQADSLLILPAGFAPDSMLASFSNAGVTHVAGGTLVIPQGQTIRGAGDILDHVEAHGDLLATDTRSITLRNGVTVTDGAQVHLGFEGGQVFVQDSHSGIDSGSLGGEYLHIGSSGPGTFTIAGGTVTMVDQYWQDGAVSVGAGAGGDGELVVLDGELRVRDMRVGGQGAGFVTHDGGLVEARYLTVGSSAASARYEISGGELEASFLDIGDRAAGDFVQRGGRVDIAIVDLGGGAGVLPSFEVHDGVFHAERFDTVGPGMTQTGGDVHILSLKPKYDSCEYALSGGTFTLDSTYGTKAVQLLQTGGTAQLGLVRLAGGSEIRGASAELHATMLVSGGLLRQSDGLLDAGTLQGDSVTSFTFECLGGTARIREVFDRASRLDFGGGSARFEAGQSAWIDLTDVLVQNAQNASLATAADSVLLVPAGFDPSGVFGHVEINGFLHEAGSALVVPAGSVVRGHDEFDDFMEIAGTIGAWGGGFTLGGGATLLDGAVVDLGTGYLGTSAQATHGVEIQDARLTAQAVSLAAGTSALQTGGEVTLDRLSGAAGSTYELAGGKLSAEGVSSYYWHGDFIQSGGTSTFGYFIAGDRSTWALQAGESAVERMTVDNGGHYSQSGGGLDVSDWLWVSSGGTADVTGGALATPAMRLGVGGSGIVRQDGGHVSVEGLLEIGASATGEGLYELEDGTLSVVTEQVGLVGRGGVRQTGGTHTVDVLQVGGSGWLELTGGTLAIGCGLQPQGPIDFGGGDALLAGDDAILDFSQVTPQNAGLASLAVTGDSLVIHAPGAHPRLLFGAFSNEGLTHERGQTLSIPAGRTVRGCGTIGDHVDLRGSLLAAEGRGIDLSGGAMVHEGAALDLGSGTLTVRNPNSGLAGGTAHARAMAVDGGDAAFALTAGTLAVDETLSVTRGLFRQHGGDLAGGAAVTVGGTYEYVSGDLAVASIDVLAGGTFIQDTGLAELSAAVRLSGGTYELRSGRLLTGPQSPQTWASGRLLNRGGEHQVSGNWQPGSRYELDLGTLNVTGNAQYGSAGLIQRNGRQTVGGTLTLVTPAGSELHGGELSAANGYIGMWGTGYGSPGQLFQDGGTLTIPGTLIVRENGSAYVISGGRLEAGVLQITNSALLRIASADAEVHVSDRFLLAAKLEAVPGATVHLHDADFEVTISNSRWLPGLADLTLIFDGTGEDASTFELFSGEKGGTPEAFVDNFSLGRLQVGGEQPAFLRLTDTRHGWYTPAGPEALYVEELAILAGSTLDLNGLNLYCLRYSNQGEVVLGGGQLVLVPEPTAALLLAVGAVALRRRRAC